jgi:hypothetical protein
VKKLISIGVALALLTMAVVPGAVAAYEPPATYSKVPFAIVASGIELLGDVVAAVPMIADALPEGLDVGVITGLIGPWVNGPLSWSVDFLAWGMELGAEIWDLANTAFDIGFPEVGTIMYIISCKLLTCWSATNCTGTFEPCLMVP